MISRRYILWILVVIFFPSCKEEVKYTQLMGLTQGTTYNIIYDSPINYKLQIDSLLAEFDTSLSSYNSQSIITAINNNVKEVIIDDYFKTCFDAAMEISRQTGGAFDITVGPLVRAYGFGLEKRAQITPELIDSLQAFIGFERVKREADRIIKEVPEMRLDVNAIAQGYAVDVVSLYLEDLGLTNYLVEIGGEVRTRGLNRSQEYWKVGVDKPIDDTTGLEQRDLKAIIALNNKSLATSGNYRKFYIEDGVKYAHTIDPRIGKPVQHTLLSATVIAENCMMADGYATAFMVMGADKAYEFASQRNDLEVYLITAGRDASYEIIQTPGFNAMISEEFE